MYFEGCWIPNNEDKFRHDVQLADVPEWIDRLISDLKAAGYNPDDLGYELADPENIITYYDYDPEYEAVDEEGCIRIYEADWAPDYQSMLKQLKKEIDKCLYWRRHPELAKMRWNYGF